MSFVGIKWQLSRFVSVIKKTLIGAYCDTILIGDNNKPHSYSLLEENAINRPPQFPYIVEKRNQYPVKT